MKITNISIKLREQERLKGFVSVTFDNALMIRGMKVINGNNGLFVSMPSRKRLDGTYQDIAHPVNMEMRGQVEKIILGAYQNELKHKTGFLRAER